MSNAPQNLNRPIMVCPVCGRSNGAWLTCDYPGCCDGRNLVEKDARK